MAPTLLRAPPHPSSLSFFVLQSTRRVSSNPHRCLFSVPLRNSGILSGSRGPLVLPLRSKCSGSGGFLPLISISGGKDDGFDAGGGGGRGGDGRGDSGSGGGGGDERSFLHWYLKILDKYPALTNSVTCAFLNFLGDLVCQLLIDQESTLDCKRLSVVTFLGIGLVGPTLHFWFYYLNSVYLPHSSGTFLRLFLDQFLFAPIFIGVFLCSLVTLEGRPSQALPMLQQEWFSSVIANWQLWIPFQFLNFQFVPQQHQALAANFVAIVWNVILSYKNP